MMTTVYYYDFWPTIRFRRLHNTIKMRASLRRRRLFPAANSGFWRYRNTRARDLATYQTVFSNGSCRNLIKVIRLIPRNNINSLFLSWSPVFFFCRCTASFCHWQINRKYIYASWPYPARSSKFLCRRRPLYTYYYYEHPIIINIVDVFCKTTSVVIVVVYILHSSSSLLLLFFSSVKGMRVARPLFSDAYV